MNPTVRTANTSQKKHKQPAHGFTLIELLVVVSIIALLISILIPSLSAARSTARTVACGTNLRSVARGIATYVTDYGAYPASYYWVGQFKNGSLGALSQPSNGIVNWSFFLYQSAGVLPSDNSTGATSSTDLGAVPLKAFLCPEFPNKGGLPPSNTTADNNELGIPNEVNGIIDFQAPRLAYTLNEAICPRNRFAPQMVAGQVRTNRWVRPSEIGNASSTILATEWSNNPKVVMGVSQGGSGDASGYVIKSHWGVYGFYATGPDPTTWVVGGFLGGKYFRDTPQQIATDDPPPTENAPNQQPINFIGHNHGTGSYSARKTNFSYVDGHVETKKVIDTVKPGSFEWGDKFWSVTPDNGPS